MTFECHMRPVPIRCCDAPVTAVETMAEVAARHRARQQRPAGEAAWDVREIARSALGELSETKRGEFLTDLLCELRGPDARTALCIARNRITHHLHDLIVAEYDAEAAKLGDLAAEMVRP